MLTRSLEPPQDAKHALAHLDPNDPDYEAKKAEATRELHASSKELLDARHAHRAHLVDKHARLEAAHSRLKPGDEGYEESKRELEEHRQLLDRHGAETDQHHAEHHRSVHGTSNPAFVPSAREPRYSKEETLDAKSRLKGMLIQFYTMFCLSRSCLADFGFALASQLRRTTSTRRLPALPSTQRLSKSVRNNRSICCVWDLPTRVPYRAGDAATAALHDARASKRKLLHHRHKHLHETLGGSHPETIAAAALLDSHVRKHHHHADEYRSRKERHQGSSRSLCSCRSFS